MRHLFVPTDFRSIQIEGSDCNPLVLCSIRNLKEFVDIEDPTQGMEPIKSMYVHSKRIRGYDSAMIDLQEHITDYLYDLQGSFGFQSSQSESLAYLIYFDVIALIVKQFLSLLLYLNHS